MPLVDALMVGYLGLTALLLAGGSFRNSVLVGLVCLHGVAITAILWTRSTLDRAAPQRHRLWRFLHAWYPALLLTPLWKELALLNRILWSRFFDAQVLGWERWMFHDTPVLWLSRKLDSLWVSEYMHLSYVCYYLVIPVLGLALYGAGRYRRFQCYLWTLMLTFFFCYLWFIFFPVEGPLFSFPPLAAPLAQGQLYHLCHWILGWGASRGAAFPSSHVAVAVLTVLCAARWAPKTLFFLVPVGLGIAVGTVYNRIHYAVDSLAGIFVAVFMAWWGPWTYELLVRRLGMGATPPPAPEP